MDNFMMLSSHADSVKAGRKRGLKFRDLQVTHGIHDPLTEKDIMQNTVFKSSIRRVMQQHSGAGYGLAGLKPQTRMSFRKS